MAQTGLLTSSLGPGKFSAIIISSYKEVNNAGVKQVFYNEHKAVIGLDCELLAGSLPVKELKLVEAWILIHETELYSNWNKAVKKRALG
jgi:hypothetical protein